MSIYNPQLKDYFYHVTIYEEMLLTYEQHLKRECGSVCTTDPDDNTDYRALNWYRGISTSFAEKEWDKLIGGIRRHLGAKGQLIEHTGDFDRKYFYYFANDWKLKEKVLHRTWVYIEHQSTVEFDKDKFSKHMMLVNR